MPKKPEKFDPKNPKTHHPTDVERETKVPKRKGQSKGAQATWGNPFYRKGRILPNPPGSEGPGNPGGTN